MLNISKDEKRYSEIELDLHKKLAYEKGRASIIEELEKIKAKVIACFNQEDSVFSSNFNLGIEMAISVIDKSIAELKGE